MKLPNSPLVSIGNIYIWPIGLCSILVLSSAIAVVYLKHYSRLFHTELQQIQQAKDAVHVEWTRLLLEQSTWASDIRVEQMAREQLHMQIPLPTEIRVLKP